MNIDNIIKIAKDEDEKIFIKKLIDIFERVQEKCYIQITNFLDPGQLYLLEYIHGYYKDLKILVWGGYEGAERVRVAIYPEYNKKDIDIQIEVIKLKSNKFTKKLTHRDVLGSVLGQGVTRECIGDILITEENDAYIFASKTITEYLLENINKVGREQIKVEILSNIIIDEIKLKTDMKLQTIISTSLRLDNVIASAFKISRTISDELIDKALVRVNFRIETKGHKEIIEGDLISVKGYGRCKIINIKGETKTGRKVIEIYK